MARITWGSESQRTYEAGLDRGLLQVEDEPLVPWIGLTAVSENPTGSDIKPVYQDGFRRHNHLGVKEFEASITAFGYPEEFGQCDGLARDSAIPGLYIDQQPPKTFNLSYRTGVGDASSLGINHYKIHLVYNCTVVPASKSYETLSDSPEVSTYSWDIATVPSFDLVGVLPSAHFVVESRTANPTKFKALEDILYGTETVDASFPSPLEVKTILGG